MLYSYNCIKTIRYPGVKSDDDSKFPSNISRWASEYLTVHCSHTFRSYSVLLNEYDHEKHKSKKKKKKEKKKKKMNYTEQ